ncbi:MAG: type III-A CRISPR-associated protein Cas10/Csm1 [Fervidobacterium sp.]|nr:type III-A CRISPR-associated protein Cas10/Csm1 [Fervidobacterium sp.]
MFRLTDVYIAALLHDIGKFYQRAYPEKKNEIMHRQRGIIQYLNLKGVPHQIWSSDFVESISFLRQRKHVLNGIIYHHKPYEDSKIGLLVSLADRVSASEREDYSPQENEQNVTTKRLEAIMSHVTFEKKKSESWYKTIQRQSFFDEEFFPTKEQIDNAEEIKRYKVLWDAFYESFSKETIRDENNVDEYDRIYYILKEYTSNIPSAFYYSHPDISLFSHLSSTAAIANALYLQFEENIKAEDFKFLDELEADLVSKNINGKVLGIVKGDLSGIQDFIYNVPYEHALKKLKGRSFYLDLIIYLIGKWILRSEGLPISNLIMSGGGHFYVLLPAKSIDKIKDYQKELDEIIYEAHGTELSVILTSLPVSLSEMTEFSKILQTLGELSEEAKNRKFESLIKLQDFYTPIRVEADSCPYCYREMKEDQCEFCESFAELGVALSKNKYLIVENLQRRINDPIKTVYDVFKRFGYQLNFTNIANKKAYLITKNESLNFDECMYYVTPATYMGKSEDGKLLELDEMAQASEGLCRWGILRGDVDNLGKIFREGLGTEKSLARVSALSEDFKLFFGYYLEKLVSREFQNCSVIYSGGDDFLIIGPWSTLPNLAKRLRADFEKFVCYNNNITVSMAIAIAKDVKFPIYRVAKAVGEDLEQAKEYMRESEKGKKVKDAIRFMEETIGWEDWETFEEIASILSCIVERSKTRIVLNYMYEASRLMKNAQKEGELVRSWRLVYKLSRFKSSYKHLSGVSEGVDRLFDKVLLKTDNKIYNHIFGCARWVDFKTRKPDTEGR